MTHIELNRITLIINSFCLFFGIFVYSSFATNTATVSNIIASIFVVIGSFLSAIYITRNFRGTPFSSDGKERHSLHSPFLKILLIVPITLTMLEVISLYIFHVHPKSIGWIHMAAACAIGQSAEVLLPKNEK